MTKEQLSQYCDLVKERDKLEKRIEKLRKRTEYISDSVQNGYKRHLVIFGYDLSRANKLHELEDILVEREAMVIIQQVEIEKFISTIEKSEIRQIFVHRYIDNMNWIQIQTIMGYNHEDTARKKHDKYLEEKI